MNEEIKKALIELGFKQDGKYFKKDGNNIKIYDDTGLKEIFRKLIEFGKTAKVWEYKRVMQIID